MVQLSFGMYYTNLDLLSINKIIKTCESYRGKTNVNVSRRFHPIIDDDSFPTKDYTNFYNISLCIIYILQIKNYMHILLKLILKYIYYLIFFFRNKKLFFKHIWFKFIGILIK